MNLIRKALKAFHNWIFCSREYLDTSQLPSEFICGKFGCFLELYSKITLSQVFLKDFVKILKTLFCITFQATAFTAFEAGKKIFIFPKKK